MDGVWRVSDGSKNLGEEKNLVKKKLKIKLFTKAKLSLFRFV